ncbi:MAG: hypothetical protein ABSA21_07085 [Candidatus Limnocylindrales bacterium]|jgi:uncharacterized membrane protein YczE
MTPFELVQWSIALAIGIVLMGLGLALSLALVFAALHADRRPRP